MRQGDWNRNGQGFRTQGGESPADGKFCYRCRRKHARPPRAKRQRSLTEVAARIQARINRDNADPEYR